MYFPLLARGSFLVAEYNLATASDWAATSRVLYHGLLNHDVGPQDSEWLRLMSSRERKRIELRLLHDTGARSLVPSNAIASRPHADIPHFKGNQGSKVPHAFQARNGFSEAQAAVQRASRSWI
jgi:hypothetical protein